MYYLLPGRLWMLSEPISLFVPQKKENGRPMKISNINVTWKKILLLIVLSIYVLPGFCSYNGYVVDKETKEPIEGTVVSIEFLNPQFLGGSYAAGAAEDVTDKNGYFSVPFRGFSFNPFGMLLRDNLVTVFKSEYEPVSTLAWYHFFPRQIYSNGPKVPSEYTWKVEHGKPYILLHKYKNLEEMRKSRMVNGQIYSVTASYYPDKWISLYKEIEKERALLVIRK